MGLLLQEGMAMQGSQNKIRKEVAYTKKGWKLKNVNNCFMRIFSLNSLNKHAIS